MSGLRRIIGNTLISLFGQLVTWTSTLGLTIAYGRFLGDFQFGELFFALTFVSLIGFPIEFGFNQQLTRDVAEKSEKALPYLWNTLLIKVLLWMVFYCIMLVVVWALRYSQEQWMLVAICGVNLLSGSFVNAFAALHYAFERTVFPSVGMMLEKGLSALVGFIVLKNGASVQVMACVLLGGSLIDAAWVAFWFFRLTGRRVVFDKKLLLQLIRTSIPFVVYGVLGVIYYRIDTILLSLMTNTDVVGWYGAGYRLFDTLLFIPNLILNAVMYPVFSKLAVKSQAALKTAVEKCMNLLLICSFPIAAFMIAGAPSIIGFLYHRPDFLNSIPVVEGLAPGLVFLYINTLFSSIIVSTKGEKKIPIMAAAALVFNLGLNLILIPRFEQIGAAVVTSLTELLLLFISARFVPGYLFPRKSMKVGFKTLIASLVMGGIIFYLRMLSIFLLLPLGILTYISLATLLKTVPSEDLQSLLKAVKNKGKRSSVEKLTDIVEENIDTLASIAEENIYAQITDPRLTAVQVKRAMAETRKEQAAYLDDGNEITLRLPAVVAKKMALRASDKIKATTGEPAGVEDVVTMHLPSIIADAATMPLPSVKEDVATMLLPSVKEDVATMLLPSVDEPDKSPKKRYK
jgi:O-antigen/teichoic acid export membrane protein